MIKNTYKKDHNMIRAHQRDKGYARAKQERIGLQKVNQESKEKLK